MADTMQFDLVSPERKLASVAATSVQIPGIGGDPTGLKPQTYAGPILADAIKRARTGQGGDCSSGPHRLVHHRPRFFRRLACWRYTVTGSVANQSRRPSTWLTSSKWFCE